MRKWSPPNSPSCCLLQTLSKFSLPVKRRASGAARLASLLNSTFCTQHSVFDSPLACVYRPHPPQGRGIENCVGIPYSCAPRRSYLDAFQSVPEHTVPTLVFLSLQLCILCTISGGEIFASFFFNVIAGPDLKSRGLGKRSVWQSARPWVQFSAVIQKNIRN